MQSLMISLMAKDRPGIVEQLSDVVAKQQGNWLESRLARLGGQFAGIIRVQVAKEQVNDLRAALKQLASSDITLSVTVLDTQAETKARQLVRFKVVANDRPGIVQEISAAIAATGSNLEELTTDLGSTPWSGEALFKAEGAVSLAGGIDAEALAEQLESLADDLIVEIDVQEPAD